jgi:hypothetical protein
MIPSTILSFTLDQLWSLILFLSVFSVIREPSFGEESFQFCVQHKCVQLYLWECKEVSKKTLWRSVLSVWAKLKPYHDKNESSHIHTSVTNKVLDLYIHHEQQLWAAMTPYWLHQLLQEV